MGGQYFTTVQTEPSEHRAEQLRANTKDTAMTITLNKTLIAAATVTLLALSAGAKADEMSGQTSDNGYSTYANQQATDAQVSDPTVPNSLRSHGRP